MFGFKEEICKTSGKIGIVQTSTNCYICQCDSTSGSYHMKNMHHHGVYKCDKCPAETCNFPADMEAHIRNFHKVRLL